MSLGKPSKKLSVLAEDLADMTVETGRIAFARQTGMEIEDIR